MLLYVVIAYDECGEPYVCCDYLNELDAYEAANEYRGFVRVIDLK